MKVMSLHPDTESESRCSKLKNKNLVRDQSNGTSAHIQHLILLHIPLPVHLPSLPLVTLRIRHNSITNGHRIKHKKAYVA